MVRFSIPFRRVKRQPKAWWSAKMEEAVSERHKSFAVAHRNDEHRQANISASRHASSVIAKAKAEIWQASCSFLFFLYSTVNLYIFCSVLWLALLPHLPNFSNCSSPRNSASIFADYMRSHFSFSQRKAKQSKSQRLPFPTPPSHVL